MQEFNEYKWFSCSRWKKNWCNRCWIFCIEATFLSLRQKKNNTKNLLQLTNRYTHKKTHTHKSYIGKAENSLHIPYKIFISLVSCIFIEETYHALDIQSSAIIEVDSENNHYRLAYFPRLPFLSSFLMRWNWTASHALPNFSCPSTAAIISHTLNQLQLALLFF